MNFYNPYLYTMPSIGASSSPGILKSLLGAGASAGRFNWSSILSNTQKTIGVVNQAIPMVKGVAPTFRNAKTMFKVMNEFKKPDGINKKAPIKNNIISNTNQNNFKTEIIKEKIIKNDNGPQFFI